MGKRSDGQNTRAKLLEAAAEVFARKGYRDTTVTDICKAANTNVASVNYYFGSKEHLYAEVWREAFDQAEAVYPIRGGLDETAPVEERLHALVKSFVNKMLDQGKLGWSGQILLMELVHPTEATEMVRQDVLQPIHLWVMQIMRDFLGPEATDKQVALCCMSVVHQCLGLGQRKGKRPQAIEALFTEGPEHIAEHIFQFSLAGIGAVRRQVDGAT
jgi:AcrR family transcriptional regulator